MAKINPLVRVHVNIEISTAALQSVVANAKEQIGMNDKGRYQVDTADVLAALISKFLQEKDFEAYSQDMEHYDLI